MKGKTALKGFTLIEMLIVIVIIGILAVVLIESYLTISKTALRIEQEKNISEESLILTQVFQAISDEATIDYERYENQELDNNRGFTDILYLTGGQWSGTSIYTTGGENCLDLDRNFEPDNNGNITQLIQNHTGCYLVMKQGGDDETQITTPGKVVISKVMFRVIPYDSNANYFSGSLYTDVDNGLILNKVHQPGFWMFIHLYAPLYQPTGINKIDLPLQLFFNLNL